MDRVEVFKSQWADWKRNPVTRALVQDILHKREELKEGLAEAKLETEQERLLAIGRCQAMKDVIEYIIEYFEYIDDKETSDDVQSNRPQDNP